MSGLDIYDWADNQEIKFNKRVISNRTYYTVSVNGHEVGEYVNGGIVTTLLDEQEKDDLLHGDYSLIETELKEQFVDALEQSELAELE